MARIRSIKPEFFTSLAIASLPLQARLTFIGLWTHVDDEGRCVDDARLVKAAVWPLDDRTAADVEDDLKALTEASLITRYRVRERSYLTVTSWREHQKINRPTPSKFPPPPDGAERPESDTTPPPALPVNRQNSQLTEDSASPHGARTEDSRAEQGTGNREQGTGNRDVGARKRTPNGSRIPDNFAPSDDMRAWARAETPDVIVELETAQFLDHWRAKSGKDGVKNDWDAAWRNWMRNAQKWQAQRAPSGRPALAVVNGARPSTTDQRVSQALAIAAKFHEEDQS